jgi:hypothetical protein
MLSGYANAQVAAMVRGVNGQGRFAEKPTTADEMLLIIGDATARMGDKEHRRTRGATGRDTRHSGDADGHYRLIHPA